MKISQRALNIAPSPTIAMGSRAKAMRDAGQDVISFDLGEPDFPTPENICRAACEAIAAGHTKYTPAAGLPKLKQAIVTATSRDPRARLRSRPGRRLQRRQACADEYLGVHRRPRG